MTTAEAQAIEDITALVLAYNASAGARDSAAQAATYTADGEFHGEALGQPALAGRETIAEFLRSGHNRTDFLHLDGTVSDIAVTGDRATATTHVMEHTKGANNGPYVLVFADFDDELRKEDGRWLFSRRTMRVKRFVRLDDQPYVVAEPLRADEAELAARRSRRAASAATSLEDATEIRMLANTYSAQAAARNAEGQAGTFTADGEFAGITGLTRGGDGESLVGRAAIAQFLGGTHTRVDMLHHHSTITDIVVDGDRATATAQLTEHTQGGGGGPFVVLFANCADELVKEDGRWLFSRRTIELKRLTAFAASPFG